MPIPIYTYSYMHILIKYTVGGKPYTYCSIIPTGYNQIPTDTCQYKHIPTPQIILISRAGGTPGWLWNLRPGSLEWTSHPDNPPDGSTLSQKPDRPAARATGSSSGSTV